MRARRAGMHTLVGAYVMDAVPDADLVAFERHLLSCEQCSEDVRGLREATARLASAAAIAPRPELREPTLQAAARIRQLPPVVTAEQSSRRAVSARLVAWLRFIWPAGKGGQAWLARVAVVAAVILAVTATGLGVHMRAMEDRLTVAEQRDNAIAAVLGARDATTLTAQISTGGMATVVMSHKAHALVFIANGLTKLPASKAYELWLMGPAGDKPVGMLPPGRHGMTGPMVVNRLQTGDRLGLTVEPVSGSRQPTSAPIVVLGLGL
jgi:anti-sigma-K factor RskA